MENDESPLECDINFQQLWTNIIDLAAFEISWHKKFIYHWNSGQNEIYCGVIF